MQLGCRAVIHYNSNILKYKINLKKTIPFKTKYFKTSPFVKPSTNKKKLQRSLEQIYYL